MTLRGVDDVDDEDKTGALNFRDENVVRDAEANENTWKLAPLSSGERTRRRKHPRLICRRTRVSLTGFDA